MDIYFVEVPSILLHGWKDLGKLFNNQLILKYRLADLFKNYLKFIGHCTLINLGYLLMKFISLVKRRKQNTN